MDKPEQLLTAVFQPGLAVLQAALNHAHLLDSLVGGGRPLLIVSCQGGDLLYIVYSVALQNLGCLPGGLRPVCKNQGRGSGAQHIGDGTQPPEGAKDSQCRAGQ